VLGIALAGLALLTLIVLWGHRLRRIARASPQRPTQVDPLWYLRTKQSPGLTETSAPPDSTDQNNEK
jgi:hypothetical protein